ncbi:MAG: PucR family transcriptional regulator [Microbacteriaceae bacterium]|nr:MAG: PucR family transcriptional regulator [Microbacteriaceae bacterium]
MTRFILPLPRQPAGNHHDPLACDAAPAFLTSGNVAAVAQKLHVHNNTARYWINRLTEQFGLDLADSQERLWLWVRLTTFGR